MKHQPPRGRKPRRQSVRDIAPPEVPEVTRAEVTQASKADPKPEADPIPDHIRRMLEAAYT